MVVPQVWPVLSSTRLKKMIYRELSESGFRFERNAIIPPDSRDKSAIRAVHRPALEHLLALNRQWIHENEAKVIDYFADGDELRPEEISPELTLVEKGDSEMGTLFRYASYHWSVPLSRGFGRRLRYVVMDKSNNKLIGIIGLTDPVIGLSVRDSWIGWNKEMKERSLWHMMDAYAFGAVRPYSSLLGGKLVATLATSNEVRADFRRKYSHGRSVISRKNYKSRGAELVLLTTTGAFGNSSILDRLNSAERRLWQHVGYTEGWGFFHLDNGIASQIYEFLVETGHPIVVQHGFGEGPNWKMRVLRAGMEWLGIDYDKYGRHGVRRGFYAAPLASNFREFLTGEDKSPKYYDQPARKLFEFFRTRYLIPRSRRVLDWKEFDHRTLSLTRQTNL